MSILVDDRLTRYGPSAGVYLNGQAPVVRDARVPPCRATIILSHPLTLKVGQRYLGEQQRSGARNMIQYAEHLLQFAVMLAMVGSMLFYREDN